MSVLVAEYSDADFEEKVLNQKETAMVDFYSTSCGPCKLIAPFMEEFATDYSGKIAVAKINVENHQEMAAKFGITSIPAVLIFRDGELRERIVGAFPKPSYKLAIDKVLA